MKSLRNKCEGEDGSGTHDALGGACGEGELLVRAVVPVEQICVQTITSQHHQDRHRRSNQGREERLAAPLVFLPMSV